MNDCIDWEHLLDNLPDDLNLDFLNESIPYNGVSTLPDSACYQSIDYVEQYLLNDDSTNFQGDNEQNAVADEVSLDVLLDSPPGSGTSPESVVVEPDDDGKLHENTAAFSQINNSATAVVDDDDPVAKKRKRQMKNRDAAVRSRERKKSYVRDLELKSKYFEAECKRLGAVLQCCLAENQALRFSLHNKAFDPSMTKQESAVLPLESLLLGSLLGLLGILCLLMLPSLLFSTLQAAHQRKVCSEELERLAQTKEASEIFTLLSFPWFTMSRRCKASRSRMKQLRLYGFRRRTWTCGMYILIHVLVPRVALRPQFSTHLTLPRSLPLCLWV